MINEPKPTETTLLEEPTVVEIPTVEPVIIKSETINDVTEPSVTFIIKDQKVTQDYKIGKTIEDKNTVMIELDMPAASLKKVQDLITKAPNINILSSGKGETWYRSIENANLLVAKAEIFTPTLENETSDFKQYVDFNNNKLMAAIPRPAKSAGNSILTGERALLDLNRYLGRGTTFQTPLWHSGFWITYKTPSESALIELQRLLISDKITFGRSSYGLMYSNTTVFTAIRLIEFALEHIYSTTVNLGENAGLKAVKELISVNDIPTLLWGFVCTIYPKGFKYKHPCVSDLDCNFVIEEILNVFKLQFTDNNAFTASQKTLMSKRQNNSITIDEVKRYQTEMLQMQNRVITLNKDTGKEIKVTFKVPNISEYELAGFKWINNITEMAEKSLSDEVSTQKREDYIIKNAQATAMRQYTQYVKSIEFSISDDDSAANLIEDSETIEICLNDLSSEDEIRTEFYAEINKFINESTVSVIGMPAFNCPKCNKDQAEDIVTYPKTANIIPLDVIQVFFALLEQSIQRLTIR